MIQGLAYGSSLATEVNADGLTYLQAKNQRFQELKDEADKLSWHYDHMVRSGQLTAISEPQLELMVLEAFQALEDYWL